MAVAQSTYTSEPAIGLPGQIANEEKCNRISRTVENSEGLPFGAAAYQGAGDHGCAATGSVILGIAILNRAVPAAASTPDKYPQYFQAAIMTQGSIFVTAGAAVAPRDDVYWNTSTKRYTTSSGGSNVAVPGARFETSGGDGDIVEVSLGNRLI